MIKFLIAFILIIMAAIGLSSYLLRPLAPASTEPPTGSTLENAFEIDASRSRATFEIDEVLAGSPFRVVGTTDNVSGTFYINEEKPSESTLGEILINARTLVTDDEGRNRALGRFILKSEDPANQHIVFSVSSIEGLPEKGEIGRDYVLQATGDLLIAGVTRPTTFQVMVRAESRQEIRGRATAKILYKDWGITIPSVPFVASVSDEVDLSFDFVAVR